MSRVLGVGLFTVLFWQASAVTAEAQWFRGRAGAPRVFTGPGGPVTLTPGAGGVSAFGSDAASPASAPSYVPPYSYFAAPPGLPARVYVGPGVFPFYGKPYGRPYDRWGWPAMGNDGRSGMARYFVPPLG